MAAPTCAALLCLSTPPARNVHWRLWGPEARKQGLLSSVSQERKVTRILGQVYCATPPGGRRMKKMTTHHTFPSKLCSHITKNTNVLLLTLGFFFNVGCEPLHKFGSRGEKCMSKKHSVTPSKTSGKCVQFQMITTLKLHFKLCKKCLLLILSM